MKYVFVQVIIVASVLSLLPATRALAHVEKFYYLKGNLGQREIVIKMLCYDETPTRHIYYFFENEKRDHYLAGHLSEGVWKFVPGEKESNDHLQPLSVLNIAESKGSLWKGNWIDGAGKRGNIFLAPVMADSIVTAFNQLLSVQESDPYEHYRISKISFIKQKTDKLAQSWVADWFTEPESNISLFRLKRGSSKINTDNINAALTTIHLSLVQKYFSYQPVKKEMNVETVINYFTDDLISFQILATANANTPSVTKMRQLTTLNVKSGEQVNLEDIIWFDTSKTKPPASELFKIYKYRKSVFAPQIYRILQQLYLYKMKEDSCNINNMEAWALPAWNLTNKGLALSVRTVGQCDTFTWAVIPYQKLETFLEKKYRLKTIYN